MVGDRPTLTGVRGVLCDVDGVIHAGDQVFVDAVAALNVWQAQGIPVVFLTNNASRHPGELAERLEADGVRLAADQVLTSAMAGAHLLAQQVSPATPVLVAGSPALEQAVRQVGLSVTQDPVAAGAVIQGFSPQLTLARLHDASRALAQGAVWVATNRDLTLPTSWGQAPGNGAWVRALAEVAGREPAVAGKPEAAYYALALERLGLSPGEVVAVGDRLETDVLGANRQGIRSVLVTTGVHGRAELEQALARGERDREPTVVVDSLGELTLRS